MSKKDVILTIVNISIANTFSVMQSVYADAKKDKLSKRDTREIVGGAGELALGLSKAGPLLRAEFRITVVKKLLKRLKL